MSAYGGMSDFAEHCAVSVRTVQRWIESGGLKAYKPDPSRQGRVLIKWADLDAWLEARAVQR